MLISHQSPDTLRRSPGTNLRAALRDGMAQLEFARVPSAPLAAELLLMHTIGCDRTWIYAHPEQELDAAARERYSSLIARRSSGIPTQHLIGHQEFWGLEFEVTRDILIPRPETEHVIEVVLECLGVPAGTASPHRNAALRIADVGTGSGCIAVALAHELPGAHVIATDISSAALEVARRNASRHNVSSRIDFIECNLLGALFHQSPVAGHEPLLFDAIASNPPYIGRKEAAALPREVRDHEPEAALFAGDTGVEIYAPLIAQAASALKPNGVLALELGYNSAEHVLQLLCSSAWKDVAVTNDLAGIPRVASARHSV